MDIYQNKPRIKLTPTVRHGRKFIEVSFDHDGLRLPLSKEEGVQLVGGRAYLPEESFVLADNKSKATNAARSNRKAFEPSVKV